MSIRKIKCVCSVHENLRQKNLKKEMKRKVLKRLLKNYVPRKIARGSLKGADGEEKGGYGTVMGECEGRSVRGNCNGDCRRAAHCSLCVYSELCKPG